VIYITWNLFIMFKTTVLFLEAASGGSAVLYSIIFQKYYKRPCTALSASVSTCTAETNNGTDSRQHDNHLNGDLVWLVMSYTSKRHFVHRIVYAQFS